MPRSPVSSRNRPRARPAIRGQPGQLAVRPLHPNSESASEGGRPTSRNQPALAPRPVRPVLSALKIVLGIEADDDFPRLLNLVHVAQRTYTDQLGRGKPGSGGQTIQAGLGRLVKKSGADLGVIGVNGLPPFGRKPLF